MLQNWPKNGYSYLFLSQLLILAGDNSLNANSGPIAVATAAPTVKLLQLGQNSLKSPAQLRLRALLVAALAQTISSGQPARSALAHLATADNGP
ncbi:MAG TPA: hypothetical protein VJJ83_03370, partial [Candidatus Babeliales bacterium]|nr:hypothetical protein [Candidatus Babeliales bacterium]